MKKTLFAVLAGLTIASASHAATQPDTPLHDGQALAECFTGYPDLSNQDQAETTRALVQSLVAHVGRDAYIRIDARSQRDADTFNAWLKETGFKGRMFNGSVSGALANGDAMQDLRIFVAAGKGMEQPYSVTVPASFVQETYEANMPIFAPLDRGHVIVMYALPYPAQMDAAALGKVRLMVDGFRDQLGDSVDIMAHTRSAADAKTVEQIFADAKLPQGNPAYGGYAVAEPKLVNLQFRVTGTVGAAH